MHNIALFMDQSYFFDHHVIGVVSTNCYVFGDPKSAIMLDPGGVEAVSIAKDLRTRGIEVKHILTTHGHFDHLGWATEVQNQLEGAKVYLHKDEKPVYEEFIDWMSHYGLQKVDLREPDIWISEGDKLSLNGYEISIMHTPGHSPGSASFVIESIPSIDKINDGVHLPLIPFLSAFVGDTLFAGSIGRVDLPYGNQEKMISSLHRLMNSLDPETLIYPGHGPLTKMINELNGNPFLLALKQGRRIF